MEEKINSLENTVQNLCASVEILKTHTNKNAAEIINLTQKNGELITKKRTVN